MTDRQFNPEDFFGPYFQKDAPSETDNCNVASIRLKYQDLIRQAELDPIGNVALDVTKFPKRYEIHPTEYWEATRLRRSDINKKVPKELLPKLKAIYELEIPFKWYIWIEQYILPQEPAYKSVPTFRFDPVLIALIQCEENLGVPYLIGIWDHE